MDIIISVVSLITAILGLVISFFNFHRSSLEALNLYFSRARDEKFVEGKKIIYNSTPQAIEEMKKDFPNKVPDSIVEVINFYTHWGLMVKHRQLPMWLFYNRKTGITTSGNAVTVTFDITKPIIDCYRKHKNPHYAEYYEYLYNEIKKRTEKSKPKAMRNAKRKSDK